MTWFFSLCPSLLSLLLLPRSSSVHHGGGVTFDPAAVGLEAEVLSPGTVVLSSVQRIPPPLWRLVCGASLFYRLAAAARKHW